MNSAKSSTLCRYLIAVGFLLWGSVSALADFMSVGGAEVAPNIAEILVTNDGVRVNLEVYVGDIERFETLLPDDWVEGYEKDRPDIDVRMRDFSKTGLSIHRLDGAGLPVSVTAVEARMRVDRASPQAGKIDPMSGMRMPEPPEDPRVVYIELFYDFEGRRPDALKFSPPVAEAGEVPVTIGSIVFDRGVPVTDYRYLSENIVLRLDWQDPWFSRFDNLNLMRHHRYPIMTFLYAEVYEIRHEALLRIKDAAQLVDMTLSGAYLNPDEVQILQDRLPDALNDISPMTVNGVAVRPDFDRLQFLKIGPLGLQYLEDGADIHVDAALIGLIYSSPTDGFAKEATLTWSLFPDQIDMVPGNAIDTAGPFLANLTVEDPVLVWTNYFKKSPYPEVSTVMLSAKSSLIWIYSVVAILSIISLVCISFWVWRRTATSRRFAICGAVVGAVSVIMVPVLNARQAAAVTELSEPELVTMSEALLNNIYRAFDFKLEDQVYDRLALTLNGEILERVYLDQRKALRVEKAGGATARVDALKVHAVRPLPSKNGVLIIEVDWTVGGRVGHWGHTHRRTNSYKANLTIVPQDGAWKVEGFDVLSQDRLL